MKLYDNLYFKHKYKDKHFLKVQRKLQKRKWKDLKIQKQLMIPKNIFFWTQQSEAGMNSQSH